MIAKARRETAFWTAVTGAWAVQIWFLSAPGFSSDRTKSFLARLLEGLNLAIAPGVLEAIHLGGRKLSHAMLFGVLALLLYRTAAGGWSVWRASAARACVGTAVFYGLVDECHQFFTPGRGASAIDWGIDAAGAATAMALLYWRWRLLTHPRARH